MAGIRFNADGTRGMPILGSGKGTSAYAGINDKSYKYTPKPKKKKSGLGLGSLIVGAVVATALFLKP